RLFMTRELPSQTEPELGSHLSQIGLDAKIALVTQLQAEASLSMVLPSISYPGPVALIVEPGEIGRDDRIIVSFQVPLIEDLVIRAVCHLNGHRPGLHVDLSGETSHVL